MELTTWLYVTALFSCIMLNKVKYVSLCPSFGLLIVLCSVSGVACTSKALGQQRGKARILLGAFIYLFVKKKAGTVYIITL